MKEINEQDCIDSLKHSLKEIYNMALFDWDTMPEEGRKEFQKQVLKMVDEALNFGEQMERERDEAREVLGKMIKLALTGDWDGEDPLIEAEHILSNAQGDSR